MTIYYSKDNQSFKTEINTKEYAKSNDLNLLIYDILEEFPLESDDFSEKNYVIRKMALPHCARGPKGCAKCREAAKNVQAYLLEVYPDPGTMARPIIEVKVKGAQHYMVYDVVKSFSDENEARDYAKKNNIELLEEK